MNYPVVTMGDEICAGSRKNLWGDHPTQAQIDLTSVEKQVIPNYPVTFLWCSDVDKIADPQKAGCWRRRLPKRGIPYELVEYSGVDHGVGLGTGFVCEPWFDRAVKFWEK